MEAALGTIPSANGAGGGGVSDRTGRLAVAYIDNPASDPARRDLDRVGTIQRRATERGGYTQGELATLTDICDQWAPSNKRRAALDANLRAAADDLLNRHDDHGNCISCKRVPGAWGDPHRQGLCKTCARYLDRVNSLYVCDESLPRKQLVEISEDRGKVTDRDIHTVYHGTPRREQ